MQAGCTIDWVAMWIAETVLVLGGVVVGLWMPTDHSDSFALNRGIQEKNLRKRAILRSATSDYNQRFPWSEPLYNGSIVAFGLGFTLVMISATHASSDVLSQSQQVGIAVGFAIQILAFGVFAVCSLTRRHALAEALRQEKLKGSDR